MMLSEEVQALYEQISRVALGKNLNVLKSSAYALSVAAAAKEVKPAMAPLMMALSAIEIGTGLNESEQGCFPSYLKRVAAGFSSVLAQGMRCATPANRRLLASFIHLLLVLSLMLPVGMRAGQEGGLNFDLVLRSLLSSGSLKRLSSHCVEVCGGGELEKEERAQVMMLLFLSAALFALAILSKRNFETVVASLAKDLISLIEVTEEFIKRYNVSSDDGFVQQIAIVLSQVKSFLVQGEYEKILELLSGLEKKLNQGQETGLLKECIKPIERIGSLLWGELSGKTNDLNPTTGVVQG